MCDAQSHKIPAIVNKLSVSCLSATHLHQKLNFKGTQQVKYHEM